MTLYLYTTHNILKIINIGLIEFDEMEQKLDTIQWTKGDVINNNLKY